MTTQRKGKRRTKAVYTCRQCDSVCIGETGRKFSSRINKHAKSKGKWDDKSLFRENCNNEGHSSEATEQKFKTFHTETSNRKRKLQKQLEILIGEKEGKQILIDNVIKFKSEKLFELVLVHYRKHRFHGNIFQPEY